MAWDRRRRINHDAIADYLHRRAVRFSQKLKKQSTYEKFVWDKKIQRDVLDLEGDLDLYFSIEAEMKRQRLRQSEIDGLRRRRDERMKKRMLFLSHQNKHNNSPPISDSDSDPHENEDFAPPKSVTTPPHEDDDSSEEDKGLRKPRFVYRVQTGYEWNKYNRTHYDHDSPPPKFVQGYKFDVYYPDLVHPPTYQVLKDGDSVDTCILRFHGGPPYQDLAFRVVNGGDWDHSSKRGFRCTFEGGVLRLYFNFKRCRRQIQRQSEIDRLRKRRDERMKKRILFLFDQNKSEEEIQQHNSPILSENEEFQAAAPPNMRMMMIHQTTTKLKAEIHLMAPTYQVLKDGDSVNTCILRFDGGLPKSVTTPPHEDDDSSEEDKGLRKPRFVYRVQNGYEWNKYNRTHYDHDSPPPKFVQGYKFDVYYPDLVHQSKAPTYQVLKDGDSVDTCILRFHGGPPYQDLAFRVVNGGDWDHSSKRGFRCTCEGGLLRLYFNSKRCSCFLAKLQQIVLRNLIWIKRNNSGMGGRGLEAGGGRSNFNRLHCTGWIEMGANRSSNQAQNSFTPLHLDEFPPFAPSKSGAKNRESENHPKSNAEITVAKFVDFTVAAAENDETAESLSQDDSRSACIYIMSDNAMYEDYDTIMNEHEENDYEEKIYEVISQNHANLIDIQQPSPLIYPPTDTLTAAIDEVTGWRREHERGGNKGTVFSPIPFEPDSLSGTATEQEAVSQGKGSLGILSAAMQALLSGSLKPLYQPADGATWDPDGRMILLSFSESSTLGSIYFASKPPSLVKDQKTWALSSAIVLFCWLTDAHLIPVELPEIKSLTDSQVIEKIAWDASGERLAISYRDGDELYKVDSFGALGTVRSQ
ncbi:aladin [Phtheirospermum japonicum]|uniref:Aladin n=1 Tax=Phtheirospermum japonicum TaxID=374723 RepID=A0A830BIS3_9LAMI|nr:aladin [Phtheirospermum japonicum]